MWIITCPTCGFKGTEDEFQMSLSDECFCPNGCEWFLMEYPKDEDNDDADE